MKLADGTSLARSRSIDTEGEFLKTEMAFGGMRWHKPDPQKVMTTVEGKNPDLAKVDEIGFVDLAPRGDMASPALSICRPSSLYAKPVPR